MAIMQIEEKKIQVPVSDFFRDEVNVPKFLSYCRECPNYGKRWSCPPLSVDPEQVWLRFDLLWLWGRILYLSPGTTQEEANLLLSGEKEKLLTELLQKEAEIPGAWALSAGTCQVCGAGCTREQGAPCRHPEQMRYSIEALGGDVSFATKRYFQKELLWGSGGMAPAYQMLVGGLLLPPEKR